MKYLTILILSGLLGLSGCAGHRNQVIIDPQGVDMGQYQQDLAECRQIARQVDSKVGERALGGALVGALAGAIVGDHHTTETGAKLGALSGAVKGGRATRQERLRVIKNCMRHRGYHVLN